MSRMSSALLPLLVVVVMMAAAGSASWRDWYDDETADTEVIEVPKYVWSRSLRSRIRCVGTNQNCDATKPCCSSYDVCMTNPQADIYGGRHNRCVTWDESMVIYPRLRRGSSCTDSYQCLDKCCREYRPHRHEAILECGTPSDFTCISASA